MPAILIVDDDPGFRKLLATILLGEGYEVATAGSVAEAVRRGSERTYNLLLSDLRLPDGDGLAVLRWFAEHAPGVPVVMISAFGTVPAAVEAMKLGAIDFLEKPLRSPDELRRLVANSLRREPPAEEAAKPFVCAGLIAVDAAMQPVLELVRKVAPTNATVLLTGESGTGKELLARCIHEHSPRALKKLVALNCAALAPALIESALFGHEKGSFTGAVAQHQGVFERADGGTLFLDEIGELDANLQAKLLRILQERTFERLGGTREIAVDVRLIAATNRNVRQLVAEGRFREDLYYRLNIFPIAIPPLRERPADVPALARFFLGRAARKLGRGEIELTAEAEERLLAHQWPGNVRELENMMERVAILCGERVEAEDLPLEATGQSRPVKWKEIERRAIEQALETNAGNRTRAARQLGISLRTLQYRLKEYGIGERK
jgi:two-component system response regulator AtoC